MYIPHEALQLKGFTLTLYGRVLFAVIWLITTCNMFYLSLYHLNTSLRSYYLLKKSVQALFVHTYCICSICAAPLNCAPLRYYSKGFILVSGNNVNCTTPSNSTAPYFCKHLLLVLPYLKYSYPSQCK